MKEPEPFSWEAQYGRRVDEVLKDFDKYLREMVDFMKKLAEGRKT